jgi:hypothetical protein
MRTAKILAAAALAAALSVPALAVTVAFTMPHMERPSDLEKFSESWPDAPALPPPFAFDFVLQVEPVPVPEAEEPQQLMPDREPFSEEWRCFVPLQGAKATSPCKTPSLAPHDLFHLL